ncbi:hypothetical protein SAMN05421503_1415 [Terribacillus aidingensis]|uniref:Uncharacterized protein n=1 Tax=Terribacillus aidingensis TaxID=586416 RepID=A0A285NLW5_9BACI|nr:hypothetical protein [Terribacillus aidingensis]SNZ09913.1 hypothetical protein SAMN05421503_1415 [Terribacillus aidingensis]
MTAPIKIKVTGVTFVYTEDGLDLKEVATSFNSTDTLQQAYASGQIMISKEEYFGNPNLSALADLVRTKFIDRLNATETQDA